MNKATKQIRKQKKKKKKNLLLCVWTPREKYSMELQTSSI